MADQEHTSRRKQLVKKIFISGRIKTLTGLHIGGSNNQISIGGVDNVVIRNPFNDEPYIPGSSLKGKMRSLTEQSYGEYGRGIGRDSSSGALEDPKHEIVRLFGNAKGDRRNIPSRLIVRDGRILTHGYDQNTDFPYTELKTEVTIDRLTATATPRQLERVPAGVDFELQLVINVWEDKEQIAGEEMVGGKELWEGQMVEMVFNGLRLVQDDFLGGSGSRGSGQVKIGIDKITERTADFYMGKTQGGKLYEDSRHEIPQDLAIWDTNS